MMNKHSLLFVICILALAASMAAAMHFEGGGYDLWLVPNSGSSVDLNPSGPTHLQDIKGYPYGMFYGDTLVTGLGTLVGTGEVPGPPVDLSDNGLIKNTVIERVGEADGSDIRIKFRSKTASIAQANIFRLTGLATSYTTATTSWVQVETNYPIQNPGTETDTIWTDPSIKVADGSNAYYRVVPSIVTNVADIYGMDAAMTPYNERTVGKVDIYIKRKTSGISYNTFSVNLLPQTGDPMDLAFPPNSFVEVNPTQNKLNADQIREWDGANWQAYFKSTTDHSWKLVTNAAEQAKVKFGQGYMIRLQQANPPAVKEIFYVTTVGQVFPITFQSDLNYGTEPIGLIAGPLKYTAFGNPYPKLASFSEAFAINFAADELTKASGPTANKLKADQIRYWDPFSGNWASCYLASDDSWKLNTNDQPAFGLMIGTGYMFRKADNSTKGAFIWKY